MGNFQPLLRSTEPSIVVCAGRELDRFEQRDVAGKAAAIEGRFDLLGLLNITSNTRRQRVIRRAIDSWSGLPILGTFRLASEGGEWPDKQEIARLTLGEEIMPWIDALDVERQAKTRALMVRAAKELDLPVIISSHFMRRTPAWQVLTASVRESIRAGADNTKIAAKVHSQEDIDRLARLFAEFRGESLTAIPMGPLGAEARLRFGELGCALIYTSMPGEAVAPGQKTYEEAYDFYAFDQPAAEL